MTSTRTSTWNKPTNDHGQRHEKKHLSPTNYPLTRLIVFDTQQMHGQFLKTAALHPNPPNRAPRSIPRLSRTLRTNRHLDNLPNLKRLGRDTRIRRQNCLRRDIKPLTQLEKRIARRNRHIRGRVFGHWHTRSRARRRDTALIVRITHLRRHREDLAGRDEVGVRDIVQPRDVADARVELRCDLAEGIAGYDGIGGWRPVGAGSWRTGGVVGSYAGAGLLAADDGKGFGDRQRGDGEVQHGPVA